MIHLLFLNYHPASRYQQTYHVQLGIIASNGKASLDSYLRPILSELHFLENHGLTVKKATGNEVITAKFYLVMLGGDTPGLAANSKTPHHQSKCPCKDSEESRKRKNRNGHPEEISTRLRTKEDFIHLDPQHGMTKLSLVSGMKLFHGSLFFHTDELHTISRGIGLLLLDLVTVTVTKETKFYHISQSDPLVFNSKGYPFAISSKALTSIGEHIEISRSDIPTTFLGSCLNHISNRQGMRHVDISDYLLHYVPTLFISEVKSLGARKALLDLVRGCTIALSWDVSESDLDEMDTCFRSFFIYCNQEIAAKRLASTVYRPILHSALHISATIRSNGCLPVGSTRSIERSIGRFKSVMSSKVHNQAQPNNLIEKEATRSLLSRALDVEKVANLIHPAGFNSTSWEEHQDGSSDKQLWNPFETVSLNDDGAFFKEVSVSHIRKAFNSFYQRFYSDASISIAGPLDFKLAGRAWLKKKAVITSTHYADRNREHRRANYHVFFTSPYKNNLGVTRRGWYVGTVIWFCKQKFKGANFFLAFVKLTKNASTTQHSRLIPQVEKTNPTAPQKYAIISLDYDIEHQVGLVKQLSANHRYSVIIPEGSFTAEELVDGGKWSNI